MTSSKNSSLFSTSLFLSINLIFFTLVSATNSPPKLLNPNPNPNPNSNPKPLYSSPSKKSCPRDAMKFGICARAFNGPIGAVIGTPPVAHCCALLNGLIDVEVAVCLCTAMRANILGINLNFPITMSLLLNICQMKAPSDFLCE